MSLEDWIGSTFGTAFLLVCGIVFFGSLIKLIAEREWSMALASFVASVLCLGLAGWSFAPLSGHLFGDNVLSSSYAGARERAEGAHSWPETLIGGLLLMGVAIYLFAKIRAEHRGLAYVVLAIYGGFGLFGMGLPAALLMSSDWFGWPSWSIGARYLESARGVDRLGQKIQSYVELVQYWPALVVWLSLAPGLIALGRGSWRGLAFCVVMFLILPVLIGLGGIWMVYEDLQSLFDWLG